MGDAATRCREELTAAREELARTQAELERIRGERDAALAAAHAAHHGLADADAKAELANLHRRVQEHHAEAGEARGRAEQLDRAYRELDELTHRTRTAAIEQHRQANAATDRAGIVGADLDRRSAALVETGETDQ